MSDEPVLPASLNAKRAARADAERTSLVLVCVIICLVTVGLFVWGPTVELTADQITSVALWGP
jgi:hypothetical protein